MLRRLVESIVSCGFLLSVWLFLVGQAKAEEHKNILFFGNSFTIGIGSDEAVTAGGVPGLVRSLALSAGLPAPRIENAAVSGQNLSWHLANNLAVISAPQDFTPPPGFQWDYVIIQDFSTRPTHIGDLAQFRADVLAIFAAVRSHSPGVVPILYETWARGPGHSFYTDPDPPFPGGPAQMQQEVRAGYELARQDLDAVYGPGTARVARVGDAFENTGWANLHADDIYHANSRGTYLAALVMFGTIYQERTTGLPPILGSLGAVEAADLQTYADAVLANPCGFSGPDCNQNCIPDRREPDCNANGIADECDLSSGASRDCDADGRPDECQAGTLAGMVACLGGPCLWQSCDPGQLGSCCRTDVDADGDVDLRDVAQRQRVWTVAPAFRILIDFGSASYPTVGAGQYWNNVHPDNMNAPVALYTDVGQPAGVTLTFTTGMGFNGANTNGTLTPVPGSPLAARGYPLAAIRDSLFGNDVLFGPGIFPVAEMVLTGMDPAAAYDFTFCASRMGVSDVRTTDYFVSGGNAGWATLEVANNESQVATVFGVVPTAAGTVTITIDKGATNNNAYGFYYLGVLEIVRVP